jgi:hypothetical protein
LSEVGFVLKESIINSPLTWECSSRVPIAHRFSYGVGPLNKGSNILPLPLPNESPEEKLYSCVKTGQSSLNSPPTKTTLRAAGARAWLFVLSLNYLYSGRGITKHKHRPFGPATEAQLAATETLLSMSLRSPPQCRYAGSRCKHHSLIRIK